MTHQEFKQEVMWWAAEVGVSPREIHLRKMTRKLASCSSKGRLTFDPSLLQEADAVRARAILHELLHLRYPNHGRMFRMMLQTYLTKAEAVPQRAREGAENALYCAPVTR